MGQGWSGGRALSIKAGRHFLLSIFCLSWAGGQAMCSPISCSYLALKDTAAPMASCGTWLRHFWQPDHDVEKSADEMWLLARPVYTFMQCFSKSLVFLYLSWKSLWASAWPTQRRWSWRSLSDAKGNLKDEEHFSRLHMLGKLVTWKEGIKAQRKKRVCAMCVLKYS